MSPLPLISKAVKTGASSRRRLLRHRSNQGARENAWSVTILHSLPSVNQTTPHSMAANEVVLGDYSVLLQADVLLGSGAFGDVYRGEHRPSRRPVAVKRINARRVSVEFMEQEVAAIRAASGHENVVSLLHHELHHGFMYLVVELCRAGDMQEYFSQNEVRDVEAGRLFQDCVAAIHHLHTRTPAIVHRDLKPQNYLVTYIDGISRVKACDFGLSRMVPDETLFGLTTACGTPHYMAPELYREHVHYNTPVDIYALGMLLWAIGHRELRQPLRALTHGAQGLGMAWFLKGAAWNPFPHDVSSVTPIIALAMRMMCFDPDDRPNIVSVQGAVQYIVRDMVEHRREAEVLRRESEGLRREVGRLREEVQEKNHLRLELQAKDRECQSKETAIQRLSEQKQRRERAIQSRDTEIQRLRRELKVKESEVSSKQTEIERLMAKQLARGEAALDIRPSPSPTSTRTPAIISVSWRIALLKRHKLGLEAKGTYISMSLSGFCLEQGQELCKWDAASEKEISRVKRPGNVRAKSNKYQFPNGRWAVREYDNTTTYLLSEDMASVTRKYTGDYGHLRGVVPGGLLYVKKGDSSKFNLSIFSPDHAHLATLPGTVGGHGVSVCCHPSGQLAITCWVDGTLDVYASPTSPPRRVQLGYQPLDINGVTATRDTIIVARFDSPELYVYNWDGSELRRLRKGDLGLQEGCIRAIGRVGEDRLTVAANNYSNVTALYVYSLM